MFDFTLQLFKSYFIFELIKFIARHPFQVFDLICDRPTILYR
ncbi:hypothetical protein CU032_2405 [Enterococcus faecium]|nr:hypothetical protein [Enterococcus faecium]